MNGSVIRRIINPDKIEYFYVSVTRYLRKGSFSFIDQALFAGTNFILSIFLARWLPQEEYGAFSTVYSVFLLFGAIHTAVLGEPLMVYGVKKQGNEFQRYCTILLIIQIFINSFFSAIIFLYLKVNFRSDPLIAENYLGLAIGLPFILSQWFSRRIFYAQLKPEFAALGSAIYLVLMGGFFLVVRNYGFLSPVSIWLILGLSGFIVSILSLLIVKPCFQINIKEDIQNTIQEVKSYCGWNLVSTAIYWFSGQIIIVLVPVILDLTASANISAALNFYRPLNPVIQSITIIMLPSLSKELSDNKKRWHLNKGIFSIMILLIIGILVYGCIATVFSTQLELLIYGGKYTGLKPLIFLFTLSYSGSTVVSMITIFLKAIGNVKSTVKIWTLSSGLTICLLLPFSKLFGQEGAVLTLVISYMLASISAFFIARKTMKQKFFKGVYDYE